MIERRLSFLIAGLVVFFMSAVLWNVFAPTRRPARADATADSTTLVAVHADTTPAAPSSGAKDTTVTRGGQSPAPSAPPLSADGSGPSYMELLARSETRRRIRASAGYTYLNEVVAQSEDSMLHRWDNRIRSPVRVFLGPSTAANFQPSFLDAVRGAFERWEEAGVPVRFRLDADSESAEVRFKWRLQFEIQRTGQTDLTWDQDGRLVNGVVTLATFDPAGRPLSMDDVRVVALHEIGHLIGLDHSSDSTDIMFAMTKVRDLSSRDIASARLLYQLPSGTLR
ncbi:MAG TPA: matrixin family metalloprotease [Gemmatimonadales bacterium]|nr:matrixin family metalloprotease [Gemmatimonadales bacterium]